MVISKRVEIATALLIAVVGIVYLAVYSETKKGEMPTSTEGTTYTDQSNTFTFTVPVDFPIAGNASDSSQDWSMNATTSGTLLAHIVVPQTYEPGTNFGDARFTIGTSVDPLAVASCLTNPFGTGNASSTLVMLGTVPFTKFVWHDAAAGNRYDTTSYRTVRAGQCYAVEYTIHYGAIENYPSGAVQAFDEAKIQTALEGVVQSFRFLP
jgi:hypothetical protein